MDNPTGGHGPILISTIAALSGDSRLEILSTDKWANPADFEVVIDELEVRAQKIKRSWTHNRPLPRGERIHGPTNPPMLCRTTNELSIFGPLRRMSTGRH